MVLFIREESWTCLFPSSSHCQTGVAERVVRPASAQEIFTLHKVNAAWTPSLLPPANFSEYRCKGSPFLSETWSFS